MTHIFVMTNREKGLLAERLICECCPHAGSSSLRGEEFRFIEMFLEELSSSNNSAYFPKRYKEHVEFAIQMACEANREDNFPHSMGIFLAPKAAVAACFLVTRFESYFRIHSKKLDSDGSWRNDPARLCAENRLGVQFQKKRRISKVSVAYKLAKLQRTPLASSFRRLDKAIYRHPHTLTGRHRTECLGDRIEWGRNCLSHGQTADLSSEIIFYCLVTAIVFYYTIDED